MHFAIRASLMSSQVSKTREAKEVKRIAGRIGVPKNYLGGTTLAELDAENVKLQEQHAMYH